MNALPSRVRRCIVIAVLLALPVGCGRSVPTTAPPVLFKTTGTIRDHSGRPVTTGMVQLSSEADPTFTMMAEIAKDGTFAIDTLIDGQKVPGAIPGRCKVMYVGPIPANAAPEVSVLPEPFLIEEKDNVLTIRLPKK